MHILKTFVVVFLTGTILTLPACQSNQKSTEEAGTSNEEIMETETVEEQALLRHVVLFKFKQGTDQQAITKVEEAFAALPSKIPEIKGFEWGTNNSPEGLDKGFTHCFTLSFASEEDRATYLPHPDHQAFGKLLGGIREDVLVVDYWAE